MAGKWAKCAVVIDVIFAVAVLFTIVGLAAVETAVRKIEKQKENDISEVANNSTNVDPDGRKSVPEKTWKLWTGALSTFLLTCLQFWSATKFFYGTCSAQPLEKCKRNALLWIPVKILLDAVEISIQIVIFEIYALGVVSVAIRILWLFLVVKFVKEIKLAINAGTT